MEDCEGPGESDSGDDDASGDDFGQDADAAADPDPGLVASAAAAATPPPGGYRCPAACCLERHGDTRKAPSSSQSLAPPLSLRPLCLLGLRVQRLTTQWWWFRAPRLLTAEVEARPHVPGHQELQALLRAIDLASSDWRCENARCSPATAASTKALCIECHRVLCRACGGPFIEMAPLPAFICQHCLAEEYDSLRTRSADFWDIEFLLHVSQLLFSCVRG